ncbi:MAG TPA: DUF3108 domain-containing protein [Candidatus Cloacimonadota bacterium]|nr:DUF3108 domain-containing protein [Candidatus Cloacimonadota bacterium]HQH49964.1 DUF3108 domain-containing protein [Candidatus Cloacimonadota bacterium]
MSCKNLVCATLLCICAVLLPGLSLDYDIKSLGLKIADLSLSCSIADGYIEALAVSEVSSAFFPSLENQYRSEFDANFLPRKYERKIKQTKLSDQVEVSYFHFAHYAKVAQQNGKRSSSYAIADSTRDIFSLLAMLIGGKAEPGAYSVDGNGQLWTAQLSKEGRERIRTNLGRFSCTKYVLRFKPQSPAKMPYIDMVTHNLLKEDSKLTLWISEDLIPLKAVVNRGLISMSWEIREYQN